MRFAGTELQIAAAVERAEVEIAVPGDLGRHVLRILNASPVDWLIIRGAARTAAVSSSLALVVGGPVITMLGLEGATVVARLVQHGGAGILETLRADYTGHAEASRIVLRRSR